ncbi:MAG: hypothetical protein APR54_01885 [Candidatus Cloacimonas sp. SDB]|nr:MAG: hypothetical protein APR54_01885 [Candidatus Cloacimonas sp. SDB]
MNKIFIVFLILISFDFLFSQTTIPEGNVSGSWDLVGSPYLIEGEIEISNGEALTIEPGVIVEFQGYFPLNVHGQLLAIGSEQDSIYFTISDTTGFSLPDTTSGSWDGIHFIETSTTNDSSKIEYCKLEYSKAVFHDICQWDGGAVFIEQYSKVLISNCHITNNRAQTGGGLMIRYNSNPIIKMNLIENNIITGNNTFGAGICIRDESCPVIYGNIIRRNELSGNNGHGGGIYIGADSAPIISKNLIHDNYCHLNSGFSKGIGIHIFGSSPIIQDNLIYNNNFSSCSVGGGGISIYYNLFDDGCFIMNNLICNNSAQYGGAILTHEAQAVLINNTIINNFYGGGIDFFMGANDIKVINCILFNNFPEEVSFSQMTYLSTLFSVYSNIEGGENGVIDEGFDNTIIWSDNINIYPEFSDSLAFDFSLTDLSPCIGAGIEEIEIDDSWYYSPEYDIEGNPRPDPYGSMPDIGAYENPLAQPQVGIENFTMNIYVLSLSNFPNPFNPTTTIFYSLPSEQNVELCIYNLKGQKVTTLVNETTGQGEHTIQWNGDDEFGNYVSSGIYYYKLNVNGKTEAVRKCLLLK